MHHIHDGISHCGVIMNVNVTVNVIMNVNNENHMCLYGFNFCIFVYFDVRIFTVHNQSSE
jgi:hypothetical protein